VVDSTAAPGPDQRDPDGMRPSDVVTSDGVRLNVFDEGQGSPVVLLAGYGGPARSWAAQIEALCERHRVVAVDRRNHGRSDRPAFGQRMGRHAADVHDVLTSLGLTDVLLVGSSMGANVALAYADLFGTDALRGLVLVDQTPKMINDDEWDLGYRGLTWDGVEEWIRAFPAGLNPFRTMPSAEVLAVIAAEPEFSVDDTRALLRDHTYADWRDVVRRLEVPVTAMAGRHSPVWPWESSQWIADNAPKGRLVVFEESGHVPMLEEPEAFNAALLEAAR
jgi:pimeloyl-ACP methyl ester carboxylesterase